MPYPNEHACRLREPIEGAPTRRVNGEREHNGKKYDVIYQKQDGAWEEQAYRYPVKDWTASEARDHCKDHEGILFEPAEGDEDGSACVPCGESPALDRRLSSNLADWTSRPWAIHRARLEAMGRRLDSIDFSERPAIAGAEKQAETEGKAQAQEPGYSYFGTEDGAGVAIVEIVGDIWKEVPWLYSWSGCAATSTLEVRAAIEKAQADPHVNAILLRIDSPGGIIDGVQELADAIAEARSREGAKPIHAYIEDLGASAAYWIGSQAIRLSANMTAQVGSIGVYSVIMDDSKRSEKEGIRFHVLRSGPFKGTGAGEKISDAELAPLQEIVDDLAGMFASDVARGRGLEDAEVAELATGRTWTAPKARALGLIDEIESFDAAIRAAAELETEAGPLLAGSSTSEGRKRMGSEEGKKAEAPKLTREQIADSYPEAVESWRAEGREKGREEGKAETLENVKALAEALPERPGAALKAALEGKTAVEAKAELADSLAAENAELRKKAEANAAADGTEPVSGSEAPATSAGGADFVGEAKKLKEEKGVSLQEAMSSLAREKPDLFKAYKSGLRK